MKIFRTLFKGAVISGGISLAAYMVSTGKGPVQLYQDTKTKVLDFIDAVDEVQSARENFSEATNNLTNQLETTQKVFDEIQTDVDAFQFRLAPHLDIIQKYADHLQTTLDQLSNRDSHK